MSTINKIAILFLVLVFSACKKIELPPPVEEDPVFSISATLGGEALNLVAGVEDYYMFSSFAKDEQEVYSFIGRFEKTVDRNNDPPIVLEFEIRDVAPSFVTGPNIEEALAVKTYPYVGTMMEGDTVLTAYRVTFENRSTSNLPLTYNWKFGNGENSQEEKPESQLYPATNNMNFTASLEGIGNDPGGNSCAGLAIKNIDFGQSTLPACSLGYTITNDSLFTDICAEMQGTPPFVFEWNTDTTYFTQCLDLSSNANADSLNLQLIGTDSVGCSDTIDIQLINPNPGSVNISNCAINFAYQVEEQYEIMVPSDSLFLSHVVIRYTDPDGNLYSTDRKPQGTTSNFQILSSSDYLVNENEEKTRQLSIRFSAVLYDDRGNELLLENGEGIIAVAYP